jgi:hypothetical protein
VESEKFNLSTPSIAGFFVPAPLDRGYKAAVRNQSARAPPLFLL